MIFHQDKHTISGHYWLLRINLAPPAVRRHRQARWVLVTLLLLTSLAAFPESVDQVDPAVLEVLSLRLPPAIDTLAPLAQIIKDPVTELAAEQPSAAGAPAAIVETTIKEPPFHRIILSAAENYKVDPALIKAIIFAESNYNPKAVSRRGAQGLMQLMPVTAKSLGVADTFNPALNIDGGVRYFRRLLDRFKGNVKLALAAYNAGSRHVRRYRGVPPFRATRNYIRKVLKYRRIFHQELKDLATV